MPRKTQLWDAAVGDAPWAERIPPAPGHWRLVQAFINTTDLGSAPDELNSPASLAEYLARWKLLPPDVKVSAADLRRMVTAREDLRALLRTNVGKTVAPEVAARLDRLAPDAVLRVRFRGGARFEAAGRDLDAVLAGFFQVFAEARLEGRWVRFKACAGDDCGLCFYDASKNRSRRYCTLRCSNRNKSRTFRRRNPDYGSRRYWSRRVAATGRNKS